MKWSPIQFEKEFARLRAKLRATDAGDLRLTMLVNSWPALQAHLGDPSHQSHFDEFIPLFSKHIDDATLFDLLPPELDRVLEILRALHRSPVGALYSVEIRQAHNIANLELASKMFFAGHWQGALSTLAGDRKITAVSELPDDLDEYETFQTVYGGLKDAEADLVERMSRIGHRWGMAREALSFDEANCLFIEKDNRGRSERGRIRVLKGSAEFRSKSAASDEVSFENRIKTPDDPFVGTVYHSLEAVRELLKRPSFGATNDRYVHAHFSINESDHTFTGDSIGLAAGLVAFTQLLKPEVHKHERFLAYDTAFTGGLDADGNLLPISDDSLKLKIERIFFSPVRQLVLPQTNTEPAREYVKSLRVKYPCRQLSVIGASNLQDAVNNRNIVRSERVCMGQFVARKAYRLTRLARIQVPLLLALLWVLLALLLPHYFDPWFPKNVEYVRLNAAMTGFDALNKDSTLLWSVEYECEVLDPSTSWKIGDLDNDGQNEVAFAVKAPYNSPCESNAYLYVYDTKGAELFRRYCAILYEYPGDTSVLVPYRARVFALAEVRNSVVIITEANQSDPSRTHYRFWSADGDSLGGYINAGATGGDPRLFSGRWKNRLIFTSFNNRMGCVSLFTVDPFSSCGVSPPYSDPIYDLENCRRGNQLCYVLFPPTDLNKVLGKLYNSPYDLVIDSEQGMRVTISEHYEVGHCTITYGLDTRFRVTSVRAGDAFKEARNALVEDGKLPPVGWQTYSSDLLEAVTYWTDSGWVTEGQLRAAGK